ncbi:hypothetical protein A2U94_15065 [Bacillus sp. VT 712]|uniref:Uncharacterized protein n=1 Tax=Priestia veravalensis TaxID=1414648 RepID=A0A0V8JQG2_9BACI|nr:hypothetical protein AS180_05190 [Priestia veravalensis]KZB90608.1 hypothetical protein A2U94_15065 [Bacillus sp. VT 712]SCC02399.1 hypothetical protein GA0061087_100826 [Priestia flexa]
MKSKKIVNEKVITEISLYFLLILMILGWYFDSAFLYEICTIVVFISCILHGIYDCLIADKLKRGIITLAITLFFIIIFMFI